MKAGQGVPPNPITPGAVEPHGSAKSSNPPAIELTVRGLHCVGCVARLTRILEHVPGVAGAEVSLVHSRVLVQAGPGEQVERATIVETIEAAGFYV